MYTLEHYQDSNGFVPFQHWFSGLKDKTVKARLSMRLAKVAVGLLGDCKPLREGVWELREDHGPGYRMYYAQNGLRVVLLLCGGDKRHQQADIAQAITYWQDYQRRNAP